MKGFFGGNTFTGIAGFILFTAMGLGLLGFMGYSAWSGARSLSWPAVDGRVLSSRVMTSSGAGANRNPNYIPKIRYAYRVGGRRYESDRLAFGFANRSPGEASALVGRYHPDRVVPVYYDPSNPAEAVLIRGSQGSNPLGWIGVLLFLCAGYGLKRYDAWIQRRTAQKSAAD